VAPADDEGVALAIDALCVAALWLSESSPPRPLPELEPFELDDDEDEDEDEPDLQPRSDVIRLHGWVVVVVVGGTVVVVVVAGPELFDALDDDGAGVVLAPAPCVALSIFWRPCCSSACAVDELLAPLSPVSPLMIVGISSTRESKKPDDGLPQSVSVASTVEERPVEWLAARRRQIPARRSRRRPAR
jgi:hypothetical protein